MILFFYNLALAAALMLSAPWWLFKMATTHKYRQGMSQRLGFTHDLAGRKGRPLIWLHAVSVGEVLAVSRLVRELEARFPDHWIAISTTTRTGQDLACKHFGPERVFYCPLDLPWAVRAWINRLQPSMLILAETEFWPNLLAACFRRQIPVVVVNARISDRSWPRYRRLSLLWKPFLSRLSAVLAQSQTDADRLLALGCMQNAVAVSGNLKFDVRAVEEAEATRQLRALAPRPRFIVAGSTLEGEEELLLEAVQTSCRVHDRMIKVIAPRHPERFNAVASLLDRAGVPWVRRSDWKGKNIQDLPRLEGGEFVLLDTIGELASVYSLATIAFVGGSLVPAGGHNPLEPAQFSAPIVMGTSYHNFRAITEELRQNQALRITSREDLVSTFLDLLHNRRSAEAMGKRAYDVFEEQAGATSRCVERIAQLLHVQSPTPEPAPQATEVA